MDLDLIADAVAAHTAEWPHYPYPDGQWVDILWTVPAVGEILHGSEDPVRDLELILERCPNPGASA